MKLRIKILDLIILGILGIFSSFTCLKSEPLRERKGDIRYFEESEIDKTDYNPAGELIDENETDRPEGSTPSVQAKRKSKVQKGKTTRNSRGKN